jgi:hypothetical protein
VVRSFGKLFSSPTKVLDGTTRPGPSRYPSALPLPSDLFPPSRHIVPRTAESKRARCVRKTATFPSGTPRVPSSALCSIWECLEPAFPRLFLAFSFSALATSRATCALSWLHIPHYFFPAVPSPSPSENLSVLRSPPLEDVPREDPRSIEYRLRSI